MPPDNRRPVSCGDQCFLVLLERGKSARQHIVREGESRVQFDGMAQ
jgi:hypothetical protein